MSINDLIATSSVHAFNQGVSSGRSMERERVLRICEEISFPYESDFANEQGDAVFIADLISYLKDKDYE